VFGSAAASIVDLNGTLYEEGPAVKTRVRRADILMVG